MLLYATFSSKLAEISNLIESIKILAMAENNFIKHNIYFILDYLLYKSKNTPFYDQTF